MNFSLLLKRKKEEQEFFLAIVIKHFSVGCILFRKKDSKLSIVRTSREELVQDIQSLDEETVLELLDRVISQTEEKEEKSGIIIEKTVFCVPYDWVEKGKLKERELSKLSKFSKELDLKPLGFIIPIEALANSLKEKTGAPVSGVFVEKDPFDKVIVYIVRNNNVIEVKEGKVENLLVVAVENLLKKVESLDVLPAKIIILPFKDNSSFQQEFLSYSWTRNLLFLHLPKIEVIDNDFENEAVINGVAEQMGFETLEEKAVVEEDEQETEANLSTDDFGFKEDVDLLIARGKKIVEEEKMAAENKTEIIDSRFDNLDLRGQEEKNTILILSETFYEKIKKAGLAIKKILKFFPKIRFPRLKLNLKNKLLTVFILIIIALISFIFIYYYFLLKVNVVLFLDKKVLAKDVSVIFSENGATDPLQNIIHITKIETTLEGEKTKGATGSKETGDFATGVVTIYNKTDQEKVFSKETVIISQNNLSFALKDDVKVASTGAYSNTFASVDAGVVAVRFGPEGNLPSSTNFNFRDYSVSSYYARNNDPFSGGTKREIQVVSNDDLASITKSLVDSLAVQAQSDLQASIGALNVFLSPLFSNNFIEKDFSKKEGEEAKEVKLHAKIKFTGFYYNKADLESFLTGTGENIPAYFILDLNNSKEEIKNIEKNKKGSLVATLSLISLYLPKLDERVIRESFKSKKIKEVENRINSIQGISSYKFVFSNKIGLLPERFPFNANKILITEKIND